MDSPTSPQPAPSQKQPSSCPLPFLHHGARFCALPSVYPSVSPCFYTFNFFDHSYVFSSVSFREISSARSGLLSTDSRVYFSWRKQKGLYLRNTESLRAQERDSRLNSSERTWDAIGRCQRSGKLLKQEATEPISMLLLQLPAPKPRDPSQVRKQWK